MYADLFKARLTLLVLLTTLLGFYLGYSGPMDYLLMLHTLLGTAFVAAGASALNQVWERKHDAKMRRTRGRPLPSGRMRPRTVLVLGCCLGVSGFVELILGASLAAALVAATSLLTYVLVYTPMKRVSWLNTHIGAVPGALPPLIGWTAAHGGWNGAGLALFAIQAFWQIPHFMAIAWIYRDEYGKGGFKMLPVLEPDGRRTAQQGVLFALMLLPVSVCPFLFHFAGPVYLSVALVLGLAFLWYALQFSRQHTLPRARQLFYFSLVYLPLLLTVMALDKTN